jgi:mannose-1-phosphate guanylyltransferase
LTVLPTDHGIEDRQLFQAGIRIARHAVESTQVRLVVGGVSPDSATSDYGWIVPEYAHGGGDPAVLPVREFVEKPSAVRAMDLLARGGLWSTFNLVARTRMVLRMFDCCLPDLARLFRKWASLSPLQSEQWLRKEYLALPRTDFSESILARNRGLGVLCWPNEIGWTDLGTSKRLFAWLRRANGMRPSLGTKAELNA